MIITLLSILNHITSHWLHVVHLVFDLSPPVYAVRGPFIINIKHLVFILIGSSYSVSDSLEISPWISDFRRKFSRLDWRFFDPVCKFSSHWAKIVWSTVFDSFLIFNWLGQLFYLSIALVFLNLILISVAREKLVIRCSRLRLFGSLWYLVCHF